MLVSVGAEVCVVATPVSVSVWILDIIFIDGVIQGQDYSDNDLFSSVVMSNVCECNIGL